MSNLNVPRIALVVLALLLVVPLAQPSGQQSKLSRKELKALIATAQTPFDHQRIAVYYRAEAEHLKAKQREHEEDLAEYYKNPSRYPSKYPTMGDHCRSLAEYYEMAAKKALVLADMHEKLTREAK
jgi:hypothetical protein